MSATITTTIRWEPQELDEVKANAKRVGLPVALYIKSLTLTKVRKAEDISPYVEKQILLAEEEIARGEVETFHSAEDFLNNLKSHVD